MSRRPVIPIPMAAFVVVALTSGCAAVLGGSAAGDDPEERFREAAAAAESGDFGPASRQLRRLASRCESGDRGREAVLLLAAVKVDPRNPRPSPAAAAQLAARYLQEPEAPASSLAVAETVYLMALDLGANPVRDPFAPVPVLEGEGAEAAPGAGAGGPAGPWRVAGRFVDCRGETTARPSVRQPPDHPGVPLWKAMRTARRERDSLALRADSLDVRAREARRQRARADSLATELDRIRSLLRQGPTPPDTSPEPEP